MFYCDTYVSCAHGYDFKSLQRSIKGLGYTTVELYQTRSCLADPHADYLRISESVAYTCDDEYLLKCVRYLHVRSVHGREKWQSNTNRETNPLFVAGNTVCRRANVLTDIEPNYNSTETNDFVGIDAVFRQRERRNTIGEQSNNVRCNLMKTYTYYKNNYSPVAGQGDGGGYLYWVLKRR